MLRDNTFLVASYLSLELCMTYALRHTGSEHHALALVGQMEEILLEKHEGGWKVGAVVTDNAGQCGRARRILSLHWPEICFLRCFAHDVNNLVKTVLKRLYKTVSEQAAAVVDVLNASSEKWLVHANRLMIVQYGRNPPPALCSLCITRWNSMQKYFSSLLRVRSALEYFAYTYRGNVEFPDKLRVLSRQTFWTALEDGEKVIRPLCISSYRLQRDENTLADVLRSFGDIFRGFASSEHADTLVGCVEERWIACEQPLFVLGYFLHRNFIGEARYRVPLKVRLLSENDVQELAKTFCAV